MLHLRVLTYFEHRLVVVDLDEKVPKKIVRNENRTRVRFEKRVKELVNADAPELWKTFKDDILKVCDEVREKKKSREIEETCGGGMTRSRIS